MEKTFREKIDQLLANDHERIEMYRKDAMFFACIKTLANGGDVTDIIMQVCKAASDVQKKFTEHIMICPMPNFTSVIPDKD